MRNIEGRVANLEQQMIPRPKSHWLLAFNNEPEQVVLDRYGPHRIEPGQEINYIRLVGVRPQAQILPFARPSQA